MDTLMGQIIALIFILLFDSYLGLISPTPSTAGVASWSYVRWTASPGVFLAMTCILILPEVVKYKYDSMTGEEDKHPGTGSLRPLKWTPRLPILPRKRNKWIDNASSSCLAFSSKLASVSYSSLNEPLQVRTKNNMQMGQATTTITKANNRRPAVIIKSNLERAKRDPARTRVYYLGRRLLGRERMTRTDTQCSCS